MRIAKVQIEDGPQIQCVCPQGVAIHQADRCIVEADKVLEIGHVESIEEAPDREDADKRPKVVRQATLQDQAKATENALRTKMAWDTCDRKAKDYGQELHLVRVRYNFDRSVLHVLFTAEEHLDAREMIKELAAEVRARIDMQQIGVRDQAGIVGGMGPCGREMCCCQWLRKFESVNVRMAKAQRLSLNPSAISGNCGRLKCCLRYEYELYREMGRGLPRQGAAVQCPGGSGCVVGRNVLAQKVKVSLDGDRVMEYPAEDVVETWQRSERNRGETDEDSRAERP